METNQIWLSGYFLLVAACVVWVYKYFLPIDKKPKLRQIKDVKAGEFILLTGNDGQVYNCCEILSNDTLNKKLHVKFHHQATKENSVEHPPFFTVLKYSIGNLDWRLKDFQTLNTFSRIRYTLLVVSEKERLENLLKQYESEEKYEKAAEVKRMIDKLK